MYIAKIANIIIKKNVIKIWQLNIFFENKAKFKTFKGFYNLIIFMVFNKLNLVAKYYNYKKKC